MPRQLLRHAVTTAVAAILIGGSIASAASPPPVHAASPGWSAPDPDKLPDNAFGRAVRRGRDLMVETSSLIGPDARNPAMRFSGNGLECQSCHLGAAAQPFGGMLAGTWGEYPKYMARENAVQTMEERINGCLERSMDGRALPLGGSDMKAMLAYLRFVSGAEPVGHAVPGDGLPPLPLPQRAADPALGARIYQAKCALCHGADGRGIRLSPQDAARLGQRYQAPPVWGAESYNDGAGMARVITAARFIHATMPPGATPKAPGLSVADAFDLAAFINSHPRPHKPDLSADFPDRSLKPADAAYPPYVAPFPPAQYKFGPWQPIQAWMHANAARSHAGQGQPPG